MTCHTPTQLPKSSPNSFVPATLHITIFVCPNLQPIVPQTLCFQDGGRGRGTPQVPQFITNRVVEVYTRFLNSSRVAYEMIKWCAAALAFLLLPIAAAAQGTPAGTIYGYALDPDHRPVPGARIVVESTNTGATRDVVSNQQGLYSVPALQPGPYNITVEANGFKTVHQTGIVLEANQQARIDFGLTVGSTTETITVEGEAPLLNTSDATVSTLIGNQFVTNMPLNGRSFSTLINLTPGVVLPQTTFYDQGQFSVNGQRPDANYFTVDGVSANLGNQRYEPRTGRSWPASGD